ncbi:MAG: nitrite/sulfite reductase [Lachnospiraceae bacterium]|nr:nitrite/sulfite reductase [Lachnospiraceae bacterium]
MFNKIDPASWKQDLPAFKEKTAAFYRGEVDKNAYKGFSGRYGSYAQKGGKASMLRLRMTAGRMTKAKMNYIAEAIKTYGVTSAKFTTCETIQLHDLNQEQVCAIMEGALDVGIVTMGGGGDFPRNVMCSPLSGVEVGEYFNVMPYAETAAEYLMNFINAEPMPRKLKVGFSNSPKNIPHATFRDLGFVAREDGKFDVYSAGGLGNNPRFGVKVAEAVEPENILYYVKAMWLTFRAYGNYENRAKARTRYMQDICGGPEAYKAAFLGKLDEVMAEGEDLTIHPEIAPVTKTGNGSEAEGWRIIPQKQEGLYAVAWHPIGGRPSMETFCALNDAVQAIDGAEVRIAPDETVYIINLTGDEAGRIWTLTDDGAQNIFETSVSCVGAAVCQVGLRDSQALLQACVEAVREADLPADALPKMYISGCPSSCGTHQIGRIGFRGASKKVEGTPVDAFNLYVNGCDRQGHEMMATEVGAIATDKIPAFLVSLGKIVADSGLPFDEWIAVNPDGVAQAAAAYI